MDCDNLTSITIPESVTSIGRSAFEGCNSLSIVNIPNINNVLIGDYAFYGTPWSVNKPVSGLWCDRDNVVRGYIGEMPVNYTLEIPVGMISIANEAFWKQTNLVSVTIPASITSIGDGAFQNCDHLSSITIPESVTYIGVNAFNCCRRLTNINIPSGITTINSATFASCTWLTNITIPASVTVIYHGAFFRCSNLSTIYCKASTPPSIEDFVFKDIAENAIIYVPASSLEAYKKAWGEYADMIQPCP